jgi:hypothetical protein
LAVAAITRSACVAYINWPCTDFGFLGATADEVRATDVTALAGFTRVKFDLWLCGMTGPSTRLESANTTHEHPAAKPMTRERSKPSGGLWGIGDEGGMRGMFGSRNAGGTKSGGTYSIPESRRRYFFSNLDVAGENLERGTVYLA